MPRASTSFRVDYRAVEPRDPLWPAADEPTRRDFRREVVRQVLRVRDRSLARGLDRHGQPLRRISPWTRRHRRSEMGEADPGAPPLTPAHGLSRTRAYLTGRAERDSAVFFWRDGWGTILHFHRVGAKNLWAKSGRLPVRDVIGLPPADEREVQQAMEDWWAERLRRQQAERRAERFTFEVPKPRLFKLTPLKVTGRTDLERYTFGIGASEEAVRRATAAGTFSGFKRRRAQ